MLLLRERDMGDVLALFLTRMAGNRFGPEGARVLSEPLGKLTALQQLHLEGKIFCFILICEGHVLLLRERDMGDVLALFLTRMAANGFGPEGARVLSEPLGKLTALQQLHLEGKIFVLF